VSCRPVAELTEPPDGDAEADALGVLTGVDGLGEVGARVADGLLLALEQAASPSARTDATMSTQREVREESVRDLRRRWSACEFIVGLRLRVPHDGQAPNSR
jgi:hypothetical protein